MPESPLTKRIKRHVIGRVRKYFAATSPGLESLCQQELMSPPLSIKETSAVSGGVEFKGRIHDCYLANLYLRSANRILMRIHSFRATGFSQLEKKLSDVPWELYLQTDPLPKTRVTCEHCKLYHKDAISERLLRSITHRLAKFDGVKKIKRIPSSEQQIFVRGMDDHFTVSIDSSGEHLYKRGIKQHTVKAPLRETLAAAALLLAGYTGQEILIDPLCGSGTFSLEGALIAKNIPPGQFRDFAFMDWPSFRPKRWSYLKRQAESGVVQPKKPLIFASDKNPNACRRLESCIQQVGLSDVMVVSNRDFFDLSPREFTDHTGMITINPPYGRRMGTLKQSKQFFHAVCNHLQRNYKGWKLVLISPTKGLAKTVPFALKNYSIWHGGLKLDLMVGKI